jgi:hypothetical protein
MIHLNNASNFINPEEQRAFAEMQNLISKFGAIPEMGGKYDQLRNKYVEKDVHWNKQGDVDYPFISNVDGKIWKLRLNDFPEEHLYTLTVDDKAIFSFDDLPNTWSYPPEE